jgi:hypothetical protein
MATTTNYGWTTPDDTDLVKDGAAAIRTLGSSIDTSFAADEGDLLVGGTSDIFEALPIGAAGTVLTSDGDTAEWAAPAGGGKVLQVVSAVTTTATAITSASLTDTTITATITPTLATSKILVIVADVVHISGASSMFTGIALIRGSTNIFNRENEAGVAMQVDSGNTQASHNSSQVYLDSPATTSATTYKVQAKRISGSGTITFQRSSVPSSITLLEIGV